MDQVLGGYRLFVVVVKNVLFWLAVIAAVIALVDWVVRTRKLNPFGPIARFFRRFVDPLMVPIEHRIVRAGGQPSSAPWWTLVFVVVGGLLLIWLLDFIGGLIVGVMIGVQSPQGIARLLLSWAFALIRVAIFVRIISSWFQISPWSKWIRWSYVLTEWFLAPLRRVLPTFGPIDVSPLVALLLLYLLQSVVGV
jgi:YggT family protein